MNPPFFPPNPVIEEYKRHIDETLLLESLKRTPEERILAIMSMNDLTQEMHLAIKRARSASSKP